MNGAQEKRVFRDTLLSGDIMEYVIVYTDKDSVFTFQCDPILCRKPCLVGNRVTVTLAYTVSGAMSMPKPMIQEYSVPRLFTLRGLLTQVVNSIYIQSDCKITPTVVVCQYKGLLTCKTFYTELLSPLRLSLRVSKE